jgi:peroxiredoxin
MTMKIVAFIVLLSVSCTAAVVRLAPNFTWEGASRTTSLRSLHGQPVVLLVAKSADTRAFRAQVKKLRVDFPQFANRKVVFAAALAHGNGSIRSNIPFLLVENPSQIAAEYDVRRDFNLIIIGADGNIDLQTSRVCPPERIRDVIVNSFTVQASERR